MSELGKAPETLGEYTEQFAEGVLLTWYSRFGLNLQDVPAEVDKIQAKLSEGGVDLARPSCCTQPLHLAFEVAETESVISPLFDGTPVTKTKLERLAYAVSLAAALIELSKEGRCTKCNH